MASRIFISLEVDDKGSAVIRNFASKAKKKLDSVVTAQRGFATKSLASMKRFGSGFAGSVNKAFRALSSLQGFLVAGGLVLAFKSLVDSASGFEAELTNVSTLVDTALVSMDELKTQILALPNALGSATDNTKALYQALSAGVDPVKAVEFIAEAAKFAKAALTDTFTAVDIGTTVLNAYGLKAEEVTRVNDILFKTIELGKTTGQELASALGIDIPTAAALKVPLEEVTAAIATMTKGGIDTDIAVTSLNQALITFLNPTKQAMDLAKELGVELSADAIKTKGFAGALAELAAKSEGNTEAISTFFGNIRALRAALALTGPQAAEFDAILGKLRESAGATGVAFEKQRGSFKAVKEEFSAGFEKLAIALGTTLFPVLTKILKKLEPIIDTVGKWISANEDLIASGLVLFLRGVLSALRPPIVVIGSLIKVIRGLINVVRHFIERGRDLMNFLRALPREVRAAGRAFVSGFTEGIKSGIDGAVESVKGMMGRIRNLLPFSPAKEGPLSDLDIAGQRFSKTFAQGILQGEPAIQESVTSLAELLNSFMEGFQTQFITAHQAMKDIGRTTYEGINESIFQLIKGTKSLGDVWKAVLDQMLRQLIKFATSKALELLIKVLASMGTGGAGGLLGGLFGGSGGGGGIPFLDKILSPVTKFVKKIPLIGGFFQTGTPFVQRDMLAGLHKGEAVIPAEHNPFGRAGPPAQAGGGPTIIFQRGAFAGAVVRSERDIERLAIEIEKRIRRRSRLALAPGVG